MKLYQRVQIITKNLKLLFFLENKAIGKGTGKSKKNAEQMAAKNAFSDIKE